jgi:WhiB family redox-sensing transcriptional regulator
MTTTGLDRRQRRVEARGAEVHVPDLVLDGLAGGGADRNQSPEAICRRCPVQRQCAAHALATPEPYGVWGGMSEADRAQHVN